MRIKQEMKNKEINNAVFWSRRHSNKAASLTPKKKNSQFKQFDSSNSLNSHLPSRNILNINGMRGGGGVITQSESLLQTIDPEKRDLANKTTINFNNNSLP
jgi:hypothetical protein